MIFIIPARAGSKGLPFKNRLLLPYTLKALTSEQKTKTIISTDDDEIKKQADAAGVQWITRPAYLATDETNTRDVLINFRNAFNVHNETFCLLYLTYPGRTGADIKKALAAFDEIDRPSLLCSQPVLTHPFLCIYDSGLPVIPHNLARRQDYPTIREISHFIGIFKASELENLNPNLYNPHTFFLHIPRVVDIDTPADWRRFSETEENSNRHGGRT